jgi:hypothetical protein
MREIQNFLKRPRYLRAIPSLVILTTAMAWAVLPDLDDSDNIGKRAGTTISQRAITAQVDAANELTGPGQHLRLPPRG